MSSTQIDTLSAFLATTEDVMEYKRALAVKMLLLDFRPPDIALALDVTEAFVSKWKRLYRESGLEAFAVKYRGSQGYLNAEQRQAVIDFLKVEKAWDVEALIDYIRTTYGVEFKSRQSYYALLAAAGITVKRNQSKPSTKKVL